MRARRSLPSLRSEIRDKVTRIGRKKVPLDDMLVQVERWLVAEALDVHGGHRTKTATALRIGRDTLYDKMAKLGLDSKPRRRPVPQAQAAPRVIEPPVFRIAPDSTLKAVMRQVEDWFIAQALLDHHGNRSKAADALRIHRTTVHRTVATLGRRAPPPERQPAATHVGWNKGPIKQVMYQVERWLLAKALRDHRGNKSRAATALGINRDAMYTKLAKLGMPL